MTEILHTSIKIVMVLTVMAVVAWALVALGAPSWFAVICVLAGAWLSTGLFQSLMPEDGT